MIRFFNRKKAARQKDQAQAVARTATSGFSWPGAASTAFGKALSSDVCEEMLHDPLIKSAFAVKKLGALAVPWKIRPASAGDAAGNAMRARFIEYCFAEMSGSINNLLLDAMDALAKGFSVLEKLLTPDEGEFAGFIRLEARKAERPESVRL